MRMCSVERRKSPIVTSGFWETNERILSAVGVLGVDKWLVFCPPQVLYSLLRPLPSISLSMPLVTPLPHSRHLIHSSSVVVWLIFSDNVQLEAHYHKINHLMRENHKQKPYMSYMGLGVEMKRLIFQFTSLYHPSNIFPATSFNQLSGDIVLLLLLLLLL